jgi:transposase
MLGPPKSRDLDDPIEVSLNDLVPAGHFYRHLEYTLDLTFVRDLVRDTYAGIGRPSIDPVVFFKLQLILFFEGLRSERQLMRVVADRLSLRWYVGYDLTETLPDHSSLTRIRERYGLAVFRRFFETVVEQCIVAGLVWGQEVFIDSTDVEANASIDSLQPRFAVEAHLARLFAEQPARDDDDPRGEPSASPLPVVLTEEAHADLSERASDRHDWLGGMGRPDRTRTSGSYRRVALATERHWCASWLSRPLCRRWWEGADHLDGAGHAGRGAGQPAGRRSPLADAVSVETSPSAGDRRQQIWHH